MICLYMFNPIHPCLTGLLPCMHAQWAVVPSVMVITAVSVGVQHQLQLSNHVYTCTSIFNIRLSSSPSCPPLPDRLCL